MGKTPFIQADTAVQAYEESKKWLRIYFEPLDEFERLARNRPSPKIDPSLPRVTDGTLAAIVQEQPKRIVQQTPTGLTDSKANPGYAKLADIELRDCLIPSYNRQGNMLQKSWNMIGKAMTYGRSTSYTFLTSSNTQIHTDFVIPYVKDVLDEKGKVFAGDNNIRFLRSWYQKRDIQAIIQQEKAMKEKNPKYETDWDLQGLADWIETGASAKPADQQTPAEKEKGGDNGGFEMIHAFQLGKEAEWYSFAPRFNNGKPLRTKISKDPRGQLPLNDLYCNIDLSNPLGRGQVELSGGVQNLMDQQMQMYQYTSTLMQAPPAITFGNVNKASMKMMPNAVWDGGSSPQNRIEFLKVDNTQIANFPQNYGLLKSQVLNLNSSQDHSVSAESGNVAQSKTQAGVAASEARLGVSDNYLRKQYETWFSEQSETSINIYFAEMTGNKDVTLKPEDVKELQKTEAAKYLDAKDPTKLTIPFKEINKVSFSFEVDPSSSEVKEDADNAEKLTEVYKILQSDPDPALAPIKQKVLKVLIDEIGAEGTDDLFPDDNQVGPDGQPIQAQQQQPQVTPEMVQQMVMEGIQQAEEAKKQQPKSIAESLQIKFADLPEDSKQELLKSIGLPSNMPTPHNIDQQNKTLDAQHANAHANDVHDLAVHKAAIDTITSAAQQDNAAQQHEADQAQAADQQQQSHDLASRQADQQAQQNQAQAQGSNSGQSGDTQSSTQDQQPLPQDLSPEEQSLVEQLTHRGFDENDIEQAIVMLRQGAPAEQVMQVLTAKHQGVQA